MLMDYTSQYTGSTLGSDTLSGAGSTSSTSRPSNRIRTVRLVRPNIGSVSGATSGHIPLLGNRSCNSLGFGLRGGKEHGTGFFVGLVERGSEADRQGLRVGDQIVRINGFTIDDAVHKEVLQLISNHTHLTLKVRSVGIIPVKEKTDPLSWQIISSDCNSSTRSSPQLGDKNHDVRISIMVAPRSKLGCGICKGPEWKPGIFIQFTKEGGISREAGLRPGDQILYCNGIDFGDIAFNEAVSIMKTSRQLDLIIRKAAGSELFPGESSGYNSSASSVTGDQSPSWSESKRLSIVKEENLDLEDRLISHLDHHHRFKCRNTKWEKIEWDDMEMDSLIDGINSRTGLYQYKPTIINLSANGTTIKQNGSIEECHELEIEDLEKNSDYRHNAPHLSRFNLPPLRNCPHQQPIDNYTLRPTKHSTTNMDNSLPPEMRTVIVDVHRSELSEDTVQLRCALKERTGIAADSQCAQKKQLDQQDSVSSYGSVTSRSSIASATTSLSTAISQEIMRRSEKSKQDEKPSIDEQIQMKKILKVVDSEKQQQHSKLMDEFRQAHRKMFQSADDIENKESNPSDNDRNNAINRELNLKVSERLSAPVLTSTQQQREEVPQDKALTHTSAATIKVPPVAPLRITTINNALKTNDAKGGDNRLLSTAAVHNAPPPPPFPNRDSSRPPSAPVVVVSKLNTLPSSDQTNGFYNTNSNNNGTIRSKTKAPPPPVPIKTSVLSHLQPPPCPSPDYDTLSLNSNNATLSRNGKPPTAASQKLTNNITNESVEMESLDSFKLIKPYDASPKPPSTYFNKTKQNGIVQNGNAHLMVNEAQKRKPRPVSVSIGEYPSGTTRKPPGKLDFLQQRDDVDGKGSGNTQFANELAMTLSRSNLRKRTESMENLLLNHPQMIKSQSNGSVRISVTNGLMQLRNNQHLAKSTNDLSSIDQLARNFGAQPHNNRVTMINITPNNCQNDNTSLSSTCSSQSSSLSQCSSGASRRLDGSDGDRDRHKDRERQQPPPSGILKNGIKSFSAHKPVIQQKSITFGDMPTVINDQLRVT